MAVSSLLITNLPNADLLLAIGKIRSSAVMSKGIWAWTVGLMSDSGNLIDAIRSKAIAKKGNHTIL